MTLLDQIRSLLHDHDVDFREVHHEPTRTSEESAAARGEDLSIGGKALLLKLEDSFSLHVMSAARKMDSGAIRRHHGARKMRFANAEELADLVDVPPGAVPPFGRPLLDFDLFVDEAIKENDKIAFNAGSLTDSIIMPMEAYLRLAQPTFFGFSK